MTKPGAARGGRSGTGRDAYRTCLKVGEDQETGHAAPLQEGRRKKVVIACR